MRSLCLAVLALAVLALAPAIASAQGGPPAVFRLGAPQPGDGPLSALLRFREAEADYRGDAEWWPAYAQLRAQQATAVGLHAEALAMDDAAADPGPDSAAVLAPDTRAVDAAEWIAAAADTARADAARVVMVNEAHHDAASRLLTLRLLPVLYAKGFRYFAAETFLPDSVLAAQPPYPTEQTGWYVVEPVFGEIVREALRLGYTLVPYEIEDDERADATLPFQQLRDRTQARRLAERTVERDPAARVLVHAGHSHVYETATAEWSPMALYFRERTGIDPLTVDTVEMGEHSAPAYEPARYRTAVAAGLVRDAPVVLVDAAGTPLAPVGGALVDVQVVRPRTAYAHGRPTWMTLNGARTPQTIRLPEECAAAVCVAEVRRPGEPGSTPLDRSVTDGGLETVVYVPTGQAATVTFRDGRTGAPLGSVVHLPNVVP